MITIFPKIKKKEGKKQKYKHKIHMKLKEIKCFAVI